ncbi:MAG TPA: glycosyltransferase [Pseudomonadales bacterium]
MTRRIAVVIDPWNYPYNGTVVSTRRFVGALEEAGYRFRILAIDTPDVPAEEAFAKLSLPGFNRIIDMMRAPLARPDRVRIRKLLADCDLLHVQYPFFLAYAAIREAKDLGIPVVCSFHVQPENILQNIRLPSRLLSTLLYRLFVRFIYRHADQVIAPSSFAAGLLTRHGLERPITVLSNGVPQRFFQVERRQAEGGHLLLSVGRLAREKQQETLLRAVSLSRFRDDISIVLAGVGPRQVYLEKLAARLGVRARIGWIDDEELLSLYGRADLFVHTGTIELEGMSVLEAMATGNVVVVSDAPASACAAIIHEAHSRFRKGDPADLAERIDYWLSMPEARDAQQRFNRLYAQSLSHDKAAHRLMTFYDDVLSRRVPDPVSARMTAAS